MGGWVDGWMGALHKTYFCLNVVAAIIVVTLKVNSLSFASAEVGQHELFDSVFIFPIEKQAMSVVRDCNQHFAGNQISTKQFYCRFQLTVFYHFMEY